jgi:hypothetical protein
VTEACVARRALSARESGEFFCGARQTGLVDDADPLAQGPEGRRLRGEREVKYRCGAEYQAGNLTLAIMRTEEFGGTFSPNAMPIALQVGDVALAREQLEAKGLRFVSEKFDSGVCCRRSA